MSDRDNICEFELCFSSSFCEYGASVTFYYLRFVVYMCCFLTFFTAKDDKKLYYRACNVRGMVKRILYSARRPPGPSRRRYEHATSSPRTLCTPVIAFVDILCKCIQYSCYFRLLLIRFIIIFYYIIATFIVIYYYYYYYYYYYSMTCSFLSKIKEVKMLIILFE